MWSTHFHDEEKPNEGKPSQWSYYPKTNYLEVKLIPWNTKIEELAVELVDCYLSLSVSFSFFCKQKQAREILLLTTPGVRITCPSSYELSNKKSTKECFYHKRKAS